MSDERTTEYDYAPAAGRGPEQTVVHTSAAGLIEGIVAVPARDHAIPAYFARPNEDAKHPVILVVSEAFGLHEHIRDVVRRFAHEGYFAVAPDLMVRQGDPRSFADVGELVNKLLLQIPDEQVMADLDSTLAWAVSQGGDGGRVGVTGFCWGGRWTWLYAARHALAAAVAWYGIVDGAGSGLFPAADPKFPSHPLDAAAAMQTPVLGLYGGRDEAIKLGTVEAMRARLREGSAPARQCEIVVYPDAGHAFFADYRDSFVADAAADGWRRCTAWMRNRLGA